MGRHRFHGTAESIHGVPGEGGHTVRSLAALPAREDRLNGQDTQSYTENDHGFVTREKAARTAVCQSAHSGN
jgi:hypothetical protein